MGIANIINTAGGGGGGGSEIITNLVNSVDGAGLRLANQGYISCADVSANRFGTNDFSVEFVLSQETSAVNADIFISNFNSSNQAVDAAVIRWDVVQNDNIQLVFTNSGAAETAYNFGYDPAPDLNEPTHYLVSADRSGNAVLYRNGAEIASVSIAASGSANVGNSGQPTVIGSPVNNFGVKGNVYRLRTYSKALSSDEAKNVFDRADVPTALVSNLLLDLDCAYANPTQSTLIQDKGPNNQDGTLNGTITQTNVIKQLNSTSARIGTTAATPADGDIIADKLGIGIAPSHAATIYGTGAGNATVQIEGEGGADPTINFLTNNTTHWAVGVDDSDSDKFKIVQHSAIGSTNNFFTIDSSGDVLVGAPVLDANLGAKKMQLEGSASTSVGPEMLLHNPAQGGGAASLLTFGGKASGTEGYTAAIKATNTGTLTIGTAHASGGFSEPSADLTIDSSGIITAASQVKVTASSASTVAYSVGDAGTGWYNTGSNAIGLATNGVQRMNIANDGAVSIPSATAAGSQLTIGNIHGKLTFNNTSGVSGSTIIQQTYNGSTAELRIGSNVSTTSTSAMNISAGNGGLVTFNGGIAFNQTNSSSPTSTIFNHYEEGTWTCTLGGASSVSNTTAYYTRIGDIVNVWYYSGSMTSDGSAATISGLPFTVSGAAYGGFFCFHNTYAPTANSGYFSVNTVTGNFTAANATATASSANATGRYLMFTGVYKVA